MSIFYELCYEHYLFLQNKLLVDKSLRDNSCCAFIELHGTK